MPPQARVGDLAKVDADAHGCPACPHPCIGPQTGGSPNVFVNGLPAAREKDPGIHAPCCGPNIWNSKGKSPDVIINKKGAHRKDDETKHCGGDGKMTTGSPNVITNG